MRKVILVIFFGFIGSTLTSCSPKKYTWSCPSLSGANEVPSLAPDKVVIQIDATPSMQGFVNNQNSRYIRTLRLLRSAAGSAFPSTNSPSFHAFGTQELAIPISYQDAEKPGLYSGSNPELKDAATSKMIKPQTNNSKNSIHVIVTDLYQENAEWESLAANLKDHYLLKDGYAVGVIGIKSEFNGTVYDVGLNKNKYSDVKTDHPFYLLVTGKYSHIKKYFDEIKSGSDKTGLKLPDENFVVFSTHLLEKPLLLTRPNKESTTPQLKNLRRLNPGDSISNGSVVVNTDANNSQNMELFVVSSQTSNKSDTEAQLEYNMSYSSAPYTLPLADSLRYKLDISSDFNNGTKEFKTLTDGNVSNLPIKLTDWKVSGENYFKFNTLFKTEHDSQSTGIYRLTFNLLPKEITKSDVPYKAPSWWKNWSFEEGGFAGDKTYNLQPFMYDLAAKNFRIIEDKPEFALGRICFAIQKK